MHDAILVRFPWDEQAREDKRVICAWRNEGKGMRRRGAASLSGQWVHLILRGHASSVLVQDEDDWRALELIARRMLFWHGGSIHGCRCERNEIRFAILVASASIGSIARQLSGGYAGYLRRRRGVLGRVFKHYTAFPFDGETFIDDFVVWLHRPATGRGPCWTGEFAYLSPASSSWITTERVLKALGQTGMSGGSYARRKREETDPAILARFVAPPLNRGRTFVEQVMPVPSVGIADIEQIIAPFCGLSIEDMRSGSRRRVVTQAKIIVAVLATRNGTSAAAAARFLGRSRSTLVEQAEYYRERSPHLFEMAEHHLVESLRGVKRLDTDDGKSNRKPHVPLTPIATAFRRSARRRPQR